MSSVQRRKRDKSANSAWILTGGVVMGLFAAALSSQRKANLREKVVLITGGSRGLGLLLARELAKQGCRIAICARNSDELERAAEDLKSRGATILTIECDVSSREEVDRTVGTVVQQFGRIDILVNNAGIITVGPSESMEIEDFEQAMNTMFWGALFPTLAVLPDMKARGSGNIVNITSIGGKLSVPHLLPYCCAKFAAVALSEGLHPELKRNGIAVTTVIPGLMRTGSHLNALFKGNQRAEYTWFGISAGAPLLSMSAELAARRIVSGIRRSERELILGLPAKFADWFHGTFPATAQQLLYWVNRLILPDAEGWKFGTRAGSEIQHSMGTIGRTIFKGVENFTAARSKHEAA